MFSLLKKKNYRVPISFKWHINAPICTVIAILCFFLIKQENTTFIFTTASVICCCRKTWINSNALKESVLNCDSKCRIIRKCCKIHYFIRLTCKLHSGKPESRFESQNSNQFDCSHQRWPHEGTRHQHIQQVTQQHCTVFSLIRLHWPQIVFFSKCIAYRKDVGAGPVFCKMSVNVEHNGSQLQAIPSYLYTVAYKGVYIGTVQS